MKRKEVKTKIPKVFWDTIKTEVQLHLDKMKEKLGEVSERVHTSYESHHRLGKPIESLKEMCEVMNDFVKLMEALNDVEFEWSVSGNEKPNVIATETVRKLGLIKKIEDVQTLQVIAKGFPLSSFDYE